MNKKQRKSRLLIQVASFKNLSIDQHMEGEAMNYFDEHGAKELLKRIKAHWASKGYEVDGYIVDCGFHEKVRAARYEVRTNLINGMPPQLARTAA